MRDIIAMSQFVHLIFSSDCGEPGSEVIFE
jgi:hypothetical protein